MNVVITGGAGYLGTVLTRRLVQVGELVGPLGKSEAIEKILILDPAIKILARPAPQAPAVQIEFHSGSIADRDYLGRVIAGKHVSVFHLASLLTGVTERDLDQALAVNVDGTRNVLEALARCGEGGKFVMTSSVTVYRRSAEDRLVTDDTVVRPRTVYGLTKSISEQLTEAFGLAGRVDGRAARLSTVVIRPQKIGVSAGAALSDVLREVSLGQPCDVLVEPTTKSAVIDYDDCVAGLIRLHDLDRQTLGDDPFVNFPGLSASVAEMIDAASAAARQRGWAPGRVRFATNEFVQTTIEGWPTHIDGSRAERLGITCKRSLQDICTRFLDDYEGFWKDELSSAQGTHPSRPSRLISS